MHYTDEQLVEMNKNHNRGIFDGPPENVMLEAIELIKNAISEEDHLKIIRDIKKDPDSWSYIHHMGLGMDVRNYIRMHLEYDESVFGIWGLDDYWSTIVECAVGARKYPVTKTTNA
jgi:hypothetical protein